MASADGFDCAAVVDSAGVVVIIGIDGFVFTVSAGASVAAAVWAVSDAVAVETFSENIK